MPTKELCPHCGASMMMHKYAMNKILVNVMRKLWQFPNTKIRDLKLSKSEYANVSKLKFWGFVFKSEDGMWHLNLLGKQFLMGKIRSHRVSYIFRDKLVKTDGNVNVWEILPDEESKQKYRELMEPLSDDQLALF